MRPTFPAGDLAATMARPHSERVRSGAAMYEKRMPRLWSGVPIPGARAVNLTSDPTQEDPMSASTSAGAIRADLADAVTASRAAREAAERELRLSVLARSRVGETLERTAQRRGLVESERAQLRAEYAAADRVVAERQAAVDRARELERAATVVADAFEAEATSASPLAAALLELIGSKAGAAPRARATVTSGRRPAPAVRLRGTHPRTA